MKKRRRKRKKKIRAVLIILPIIMIIIGGIVIVKKTNLFDNKNDKPKIENKDDLNKENNEEETISKNDDESNPTTSTLNKAPLSNIEYQNLEDGEYLTEKGYTLKIENKIATIDGMLIVNKTFSLPNSFKPTNPKQQITTEVCNSCLDIEVMEAFNLMKSDATSIGLNIWIQSGYRSYTYQDTIYNNYVARDGKIMADTYSARAGHSEHQTGLCFDLNTIDDSFANTDEGKWINDNAYLYGFIIRYPKNKENITGYQYESWHLRYVGKDLAKVLYNDGNWITIEEHFGITSVY